MTHLERDYKAAVDNGIGLFMRDGYLNVSVDDIIKSSGLNRYSIYSAFGGKLEFFIACIQQYCATAVSNLEQLVEDPTLAPDAAARQNLYEAVNDMWTKDAGCLVCENLAEIRKFAPPLEAECVKYFETKQSLFTRLFERAREKGLLAEGLEPEAAAAALLIFKFGLTNEVKRKRDINDAKKSIDAFVCAMIKQDKQAN